MTSAAASAQDAMRLPIDPAPLEIETSSGNQIFSVEVADDPGERSAGLMFRAEMPDDRGMLFVFESPHSVSFWMKNTPMPLDLVFIEQAGRIVAIMPGEPFSEAPIGPEQPVSFVLELKRGTASARGIEVGDTVEHPLINAVGTAN